MLNIEFATVREPKKALEIQVLCEVNLKKMRRARMEGMTC